LHFLLTVYSFEIGLSCHALMNSWSRYILILLYCKNKYWVRFWTVQFWSNGFWCMSVWMRVHVDYNKTKFVLPCLVKMFLFFFFIWTRTLYIWDLFLNIYMKMQVSKSLIMTWSISNIFMHLMLNAIVLLVLFSINWFWFDTLTFMEY